MMRVTMVAVLGSLLTFVASSRAQVEIAPAPREIRPDGTRDPVPEPASAKKETPLEIVDRIIKNSNAVGEKLAKTDLGTETRGTQKSILKDIQSLIDQQENPSPKPDDNQNKNDKDKNSGDKQQKKDDMTPKGGMNDQEPMNKGGKEQQAKGNEDAPHGRKPRMQAGRDPMPMGGKDPMNSKQQASNTPQKNPKNAGGARPDPSKGTPKNQNRTVMPFEDEIVKEVWGHLPDKLRQQAAQYYQQDFMPRYSELLKLYYSSLTEKGGKR